MPADSFSGPPDAFDHVDVLVVGAGLAGIGMGRTLVHSHPGRSFAIVEARESIGGTWDLFRYPGIRSDSDLQAYGLGFKPWRGENAIADGHEILEYLNEAIDENDLRRRIHLGTRVVRADFSTPEQRWLVTLERVADGERFDVSATMLFSAAGYYDADEGFTPEFAGRDDFRGQIVHPQHWPEDLDYAGKKVVVIGSGATAVTLLPSIAEHAGHVTMLQRSPSYVIPIPRRDPISDTLRRFLPETLAYRLAREASIRKGNLVYKGSRRFPRQARALVRALTARALPEGYDVDTHFHPEYAPWDQRMCMVPDGDLFAAIRKGRADVVTDRIVRFTGSGIELASGTHLEADVIVTATGLKMVPFGKIEFAVDGRDIDLPDQVIYKTVMVSDLPNFAFTVGYINHSWTLKSDLVCDWFSRLLDQMDERGCSSVVPVVGDGTMPVEKFIDFDAGYINRAMHLFPKQGAQGPWRAPQDFNRDRIVLGKDPFDDPELNFRTVPAAAGVGPELTEERAK